MNLRELKLNESFESIVGFEKLKQTYTKVCKKIESENDRYKESKQTLAEKTFIHFLRKKTKLKFYENTWIGRRNVDIFIPSIKGKKRDFQFKGIVFEIDGGIHNSEGKIRKDTSLQNQLTKLNILMKTLLNNEQNKASFVSDFHELLKHPRMTTRERKRLWRNIYIFTIIKNCNKSEMENYLGVKAASYIEKIRGMYDK
jgi:hypothetical protein